MTIPDGQRSGPGTTKVCFASASMQPSSIRCRASSSRPRRERFDDATDRKQLVECSCGRAIALALRYDRPEHVCTTHAGVVTIASSDATAIDLHRRLRLRSQRELLANPAKNHDAFSSHVYPESVTPDRVHGRRRRSPTSRASYRCRHIIPAEQSLLFACSRSSQR